MATKAIQQSTYKIQNVRARLSSLQSTSKLARNQKGETIDIEAALQKSFIKYNQIEDSQETGASIELGGKDEEDIKVDNKLWKYFQAKAVAYAERIEIEKVYEWQKLLKNILREIDKKITTNELHRQQLEAMNTSRYRQIHSLYKQIQALKLQKSLQKATKSNRDKKAEQITQATADQKIKVLKQNIESLNQEITERAGEGERIGIELLKMSAQQKSLLINFLKEGYYLNDGVKLVLQKLREIGYIPSVKDFPSFLDNKSRQYLMRQYEGLSRAKQQRQQQEQKHRKSTTEKSRSKSNIELGGLAKKEKFTEIYNGTKQLLMQLVLKQEWRNQQPAVKLPKIDSRPNSVVSLQRLEQQQKKRVKLAYDLETREKVKKFLFGVRLETVVD